MNVNNLTKIVMIMKTMKLFSNNNLRTFTQLCTENLQVFEQ